MVFSMRAVFAFLSNTCTYIYTIHATVVLKIKSKSIDWEFYHEIAAKLVRLRREKQGYFSENLTQDQRGSNPGSIHD